MPRKILSLLERFWQQVAVANDESCWEWIGPRGHNGYGYIGAGTRKHGIISAHKLSWILFHQRLPRSGLLVCHNCSNRGCVNPFHLFEGTYTENRLQAFREGSQPRVRSGRGRQHAA